MYVWVSGSLTRLYAPWTGMWDFPHCRIPRAKPSASITMCGINKWVHPQWASMLKSALERVFWAMVCCVDEREEVLRTFWEMSSICCCILFLANEGTPLLSPSNGFCSLYLPPRIFQGTHRQIGPGFGEHGKRWCMPPVTKTRHLSILGKL